MNISSIFGVAIGIAVMYGALSSTTENFLFFLDMHGLLIVFGGTLAAASISYPIRDVMMLLRVFFLGVLGKRSSDPHKIIGEILDCSKKYTQNFVVFQEYIRKIKHPFLLEGLQMLSSGIFSDEEIEKLLRIRLKQVEKSYHYEANMFRVIGKFPPAFGLLATTLGMIALLQKLGQPDSQKLIGPAMSIGLIGTLYGIALANLFFLPIAENLTERTLHEVAIRKIIIEGILAMKKKDNAIILREHLYSYLSAEERSSKKAVKNKK